MGQSQKGTKFLALPAELREQIYAEALTSLEQGPEILRTCRQIEREARKFLYQRPINFPNQLALYTWLDATPSNLLSQVTNVSVAVQDIDLRAILRLDTRAPSSSDQPRLLTWESYEAEVGRLVSALERFPHMKAVNIVASSVSQSHLYGEFVSRVLERLRSKLPHVEALYATREHARMPRVKA